MKTAPKASVHHAFSMTWLLVYSSMPVTAQTTWTPATRNAVPEIMSAGLTPGGFRLEMAAPPGSYMLERSTTMLPGSWQPAGAIDPVWGSGELTDAAALSLPNAFYRIAGGFEETAMKLISFESTVSSSGYVEVGMNGGLWTGNTVDELLFQTSDETNGLITLMAGGNAKFRMESTSSGVVSAYMEKWNDLELFPVTIGASDWGIAIDNGNLSLMKAEGGSHSLVGILQHAEDHQETDEFGTCVSSDKSVELHWAIAKSTDADPSDLAGE